jgi:Fe-S oxidoreductase
MACSFRHKGEFSPSISAIKILEKKNGVGYFISLAEKKDGENLSCIGCRECVRFCPVSEDLENVIAEFNKKLGKVQEAHEG